jgi:nonsense-mediated mRNA decay protein 3
MQVDAMDEDVGGLAPTTATLPTILCCMCGTGIAPNPANMCVACIRGRVDITESIPKQSSVYYCKGCARYLQPPKNWVACELESKELLSLCIKRLKGLSKVKLVDAGFRWTEPHSRRIHLRLLVQKEVFNNTILQQEFVVEFVVEYQQCDMCRRDAADFDQWQAVVQARQKVPHKRTFLYLEQLILKHNAHEDTLGIKVHPDGLDFYFLSKSHALKFVSFLAHCVPMKYKTSDHLVSHDANSNEYRYNYTFSVDIIPLCKDDLLCLPKSLSVSLGGFGPLALVTRISQNITIIDPATLKTAEISPVMYFKAPFTALMSSKQTTEFSILDIETDSADANGKYLRADATVARAVDYGQNDDTYLVRTHLGRFLHPGDLALGFDIKNAVYSESLVAGHKKNVEAEFPDILLVKKTYSKRDRAKKRAWRLARLNMQLDDTVQHAGAAGKQRGERGVLDPQAREAQDHEDFMQELEQDKDMRTTINLYKDPAHAATTTASEAGVGMDVLQRPSTAMMNAVDLGDDEDYPEVSIDELLDGLVIDDGTEYDDEGEDGRTPSGDD